MSCTPKFSLNNYKSLKFWAVRHCNINKNDIISNIEKIYKRNPEVIQNKATKEAIEFYKLAGEVVKEYHKLKGLVHFDLYPEMVLLGIINTEYDLIDLLLEFFMNRFPRFFICLEKKDWIFIGTKRTDIKFKYPVYKNKYYKIKNLDFNEFLEFINKNTNLRIDLGNFNNKDWINYYNSQYIKSRKNLRLAKQLLPIKFKKKTSLEHEFFIFDKEKYASKKISDYFD